MSGDVYDLVRGYGRERKRALERAAGRLDAIVSAVVASLRAGDDVNLERAAREAGIAKQTLYDRIPRDLLEQRAQTPTEDTR